MRKVNRLEVIGDQGQILVIWVPKAFEVSQSLQDDGRTLKIFLNGNQQQPASRKTLFRDGKGRD